MLVVTGADGKDVMGSPATITAFRCAPLRTIRVALFTGLPAQLFCLAAARLFCTCAWQMLKGSAVTQGLAALPPVHCQPHALQISSCCTGNGLQHHLGSPSNVTSCILILHAGKLRGGTVPAVALHA